MNNATEQLATWRTEIDAELAEAKKELPPLKAEHETAVAAASAAEAGLRDMQHILAGRGHFAGPFAMRLAAQKTHRDAASGRAVKARGTLEAARNRVAELEHALAQLDALLTPAGAQEAA
jgi:hypothetical protein